MSPNRLNNKIDKKACNERYLVNFHSPAKMARNVFVGYPSSYSEGMSNLGFHFVFGKLKQKRSMRVERFFTDTSPLTFESGIKISSAAAIFFSLSFEEDYLNLVRILIDSGIEPLREERKCRPIIIAGGPAVSANPFPMSVVADIISIGEGEETVGRIADFVEIYEGGGTDEIYRKLDGIEGIFACGQSGEGVGLAHKKKLTKFPKSVVLSAKTVFSDMALMEVSRGCPGSCCFCLASAIYSPVRVQSYESILETLDEMPEFVNKIGMVSTSVTFHPAFKRIVEEVIKRGIVTSFSSLRAEDIDKEKANLIGRVGTKSVAMAPETGSERMRFILGKRVRDSAYFNAAALLASEGIKNFTIYLLSGYPGETAEVVKETGVFIRNFKKAVGRGIVSSHINVVIPKPWTPLQFHAMPERKNLENRLKELEGVCEGVSRNIRAKSVRSALRQAVLSLGNEDVGKAVVEFGRGRVSWKKALANNNIDPGFIHDRGRISQAMPWEVISGIKTRGALLRIYKEMLIQAGEGEPGV